MMLKAHYGSPGLNNKDDPVDELFFIVLSQMTTSPSYERVFDRLKAWSDGWERLLTTPVGELKRVISDAGLSNQKAPKLLAIARRLREDFGSVTLAPLGERDDEAVEAYLTGLPGVGVKSAKCVMMYALGRCVLPVDTHVARVARRLGLSTATAPARLHEELEEVVPPNLRYDFHVNAVAHGRAVCQAKVPRCGACVLAALCPSVVVSDGPMAAQPGDGSRA